MFSLYHVVGKFLSVENMLFTYPDMLSVDSFILKLCSSNFQSFDCVKFMLPLISSDGAIPRYHKTIGCRICFCQLSALCDRIHDCQCADHQSYWLDKLLESFTPLNKGKLSNLSIEKLSAQ